MKRGLAFALAVLGCGHAAAPPPCTPGGDGSYTQTPYDKLSRYCMVQWTGGQMAPLAGVTPYDLNTPLFSDYAVKVRTVWMPAGTSAAYDQLNAFAFPSGTVITKSFGFRDDFRKSTPAINWIETRVLLKSDAGWQGYTYLWNDTHTEATLDYSGKVQSVSWLDESGAAQQANYLVPSNAQCKQCHDSAGAMTAIGPKARNLNRAFAYADGSDNQLSRWTKLGILSGAPADPAQAPRLAVWNDATTGTVEQRARAYLETNCAHCHSATGEAYTTGFFLATTETDPTHLGFCKAPVAAGEGSGGLRFDVVPGQPDQSIVSYRMNATTPGAAMPQIARSAVDKEGLALVRQWIAGLAGPVCH